MDETEERYFSQCENEDELRAVRQGLTQELREFKCFCLHDLVCPSWECRDCACLDDTSYFEVLQRRWEQKNAGSSEP